jgi:CIC family chloride channel protein
MKKPPLRARHLMLLATLVGVISGLGAIALYVLIDLSSQFFLEGLDTFTPPKPGGELPLFEIQFKYGAIPLYLLPAIGGLLSGLLVYSLAPEAEGHGTDAVIRAFHRMRGDIRGRVPIVKALATAVTIGSGGSAGREGPIAQIGAGFGSFLASLFDLSDRDKRVLVVCGMAGGIGSIFRSPFGGAIFAIEVLYRRDYEVEAMIPAFTSSIVAYTVFEVIFGKLTGTPFGTHTIFSTPPMSISSAWEMFVYLLLGLVAAGIAIGYVKVFYFIHDSFKKLRISPYVKPVIGGVLTGVIALFAPQALGMSYGYVQMAIDGNIALQTILIILVAKILATSFTIGSGGSGGVFAPSVVIGSMVGATIGYLFADLMPFLVTQPESYVLVGMAAFVAAVAKTPIAAIMMVLEMTGGYSLLPALMLAAIVAYKASGDISIYSEQVESRISSPAHRMEMTVDVLENIHVNEAMTPAEKVFTVSPHSTVAEVLQAIYKTGHLGFPVVQDGRLVGIITLNDVMMVPVDKRDETTVEEAMTRDVIVAHPDETLEEVLGRLAKHNIGRLPVVAREDGKLIGIITRSDIVRAHAAEIATRAR